MNLFKCFLVLVTVFCCVWCTEEDKVIRVEEQYDDGEGSREGKQLRELNDQEGWRVVDSQEYHQNSREWIPRERPSLIPEDSLPERPIVRRRRIRKRKRRPPPVSEEFEEFPQRRRRIRPQTLDEINGSWREIEDESLRRPYNRRRITPVYAPETHNEEMPPLTAVLHVEDEKEPEKPQLVYERIRDPFTALKEVEAKAQLRRKQEIEQETTTVANLKTLLKQTGGSLSLSEVLQKKNLSLDDLLQGKHQAISALTEKPDEMSEITSLPLPTTFSYPEEDAITETYPSFEAETVKDVSRNGEDSTERAQVEDTQKNKRLGMLHIGERIKSYPELKKYEVINEPTTERRIFVPSHPKYYTAFNYKPNMVKIKPTEVVTKSPEKNQSTHFTTSAVNISKYTLGSKYLDFRSKYVTSKPKIKMSLPMTSAKMNKINNSLNVTENSDSSILTTTPFSLQAFKIDLKDLFGISEIVNKSEVHPNEEENVTNITKNIQEEGPLKMTIDINSLLLPKNTTQRPSAAQNGLIDSSTNEISQTLETSAKYREKLKSTSARDEIMEILKDHISRQNLSRILEMRNMTIEELVAQRERGSSQLHLADIFHNQTREPEPPNEPYIGHIGDIPLDFFDRKPKTIPNSIEIKKDSQGSNYFASVIDTKPLEPNKQDSEINTKPKEVYTVTSFPTYKIEMEKIMKQNQPQPFQVSIWKSLYPNLYTGNSQNNNQQDAAAEILNTAKVENVLEDDVQRLEDIENTISEVANDRFNIDYEEEESGYSKLPSGVKSAIIASAAIVGGSLLVFLTIFIVFKWSQKQKQRLCYKDSFSCSRIKSPILDSSPKRTIRTIMCETLGRKRKYSNMYPQNMSDYMWENDKKSFQH